MEVIGIEIFTKILQCGRRPPVQLTYCIALRKGVKSSSGSMLSSTSDFLLLFLQALQSTATSLPGPRSGNPGYVVGKPLLALTGDISHSVSFLGLSGLLQTNEKSCSC